MSSWLQKIIIFNNSSDISSLNIRDDVYISGNLHLYPQNYRPTTTNNNIDLGLTSNGTYLSYKRIKKEIEFTFFYPDVNISQAVYRIALKAITDSTPLTLRDYVSPEDEDYSTTYTDRLGFIVLPINKSIVVKNPSDNKRYNSEGFSFIFKETVIRKN